MKLEQIVGKTFENCDVPLAFREYRRCIFKRCTFVYDGEGPTSLRDNHIEGMMFRVTDEKVTRFLHVLAGLGQLKIPLL